MYFESNTIKFQLKLIGLPDKREKVNHNYSLDVSKEKQKQKQKT